MSYVGEKTVREVHSWLMNAPHAEVLSTREIQDGFFQFWRSEIFRGIKHSGGQQVYRALYELRRRGLVKNVPAPPGRDRGRRPIFWTLEYDAPLEVKITYCDLEAVRKVLREVRRDDVYVTAHTIYKRCGLGDFECWDAIHELLRRGEIEEITVKRNNSYSRAFRLKPR